MCVCLSVVCLLSDSTQRKKGGRSPNLQCGSCEIRMVSHVVSASVVYGTTFLTLALAAQSICMHPSGTCCILASAPLIEMRTTVVPVGQTLLKFLNHTFVADNLAHS